MVQISQVINIAKQAGKAVMECIDSGLITEYKPDGSPVTNADNAANQIILDGLHSITPDVHIVSEEDKKSHKEKPGNLFWCTDPIDGTRTMGVFAEGDKKQTGFGVHIGLVEDGKPTKGVVYFPAKDGGTLYYTGDNGKAYKQVGDSQAQEIKAKAVKDSPSKILAAVPWRKNERPSEIRGLPVEHIPAVGGGRLCKVAEGKADLAWMNGNFALWDLAAGHAILRAAGGDLVIEATGKSPNYNNSKLKIPPSIGVHLDSLIRLGYQAA